MREKTKNKKFSFNAFDVFVLLIVAVLIGTIIYRAYGEISRSAKKDNGVFVLEFVCESEYDSISDYVNEGDEVYAKESGILIGYMRRTIGSQALYRLDGAETEGESDSGYEAVRLGGALNLNGNAEKSSSGEFYVIDGINITVGATIEVYTDTAEFTISVKKIANR